MKTGDSLMLGRNQVSEPHSRMAGLPWDHRTGWSSTENKVRLCVLLENELQLQDVSRGKKQLAEHG